MLFLQKVSGQKILKKKLQLKSLRKIVYLISPKKIYKNFYHDLSRVLSIKNVKYFQLRLKKLKKNEIIKVANKIRKITKKNNVKFIINDSPEIALAVNADGVHLGQKDLYLYDKKLFKNKILGITCHNSKLFAKKALNMNADYLAFGSFFKSYLKPKAKVAKLNILKWAKKNSIKPIVAIGGINNFNYKKLIKSGANYIAISSYIWDNPNLKPEIAIKKFK